MAALSALNASPSPSISNTYTQCIQSLGIFVQALRDPDCLVCCRGLVHVADIVDEYGRAKIWGDQTKACLPEKARGSLDDTLRHDTDLKSQVQEILLRLVAILEQGKLEEIWPFASMRSLSTVLRFLTSVFYSWLSNIHRQSKIQPRLWV